MRFKPLSAADAKLVFDKIRSLRYQPPEWVPPPESIAELLNYGVSDETIARMWNCPVQVVHEIKSLCDAIYHGLETDRENA